MVQISMGTRSIQALHKLPWGLLSVLSIFPTAAMWFERVTQLLRKRISSCEIQIITPPQSVGPSVSQGNSICQGWERKGVQLLLSELPGSVFLGRLFVAHWGEERGFEALL